MGDLAIKLTTIYGFLIYLAMIVLPSVLLSKTLFKKLKIVYQTLFSFGMVIIINFLLINKLYAMHDFRDYFMWWILFIILTYFMNLRLDKEGWEKFMKKLYKQMHIKIKISLLFALLFAKFIYADSFKLGDLSVHCIILNGLLIVF